MSELCKKALGLQYPNTLNRMLNLGSMYWSLGQQDKAKELGTQVIEIRKRTSHLALS